MRKASEHEALRYQPVDDHGSIELGTVGWHGEADGEHVSHEPGGLTLVKVTLFRGHVAHLDGEKLDEAARGHEILAQLSAPTWYAPEPGTVVHVSIPAGFRTTPGAPMIIGVAQKSPANQFASNGGADAILDFGPDRRVIIKAGKGVILSDYDNDWVGVSPEIGFKVGGPDASGCNLKSGAWQFYACNNDGDVKAMVEASAFAGIRFAFDDGKTCGMTFGAGAVIPFGEKFAVQCAATYLHPLATPATYVLVGGPPGAPATSVFAF